MTLMGLAATAACGSLSFCAVYLAAGEDARAGLQRAVAQIARFAGGLRDRDGKRQTGKGRLRRQTVREMPMFLDVVTLGLSSGLSFDASLELYCTRYDTQLARAMRSALMSWRIGACGRAEALYGLARELDTPSLARFAATVDEALSFGSPLAEVLTRQAQTIRDDQRAETEEEIERAPVKMLIPLGTLIVPAMLLSILGPLLAPALGMQ